MDFFSAQDRARRSSGRLVWLLALAVLGLIATAALAVAVVVAVFDGQSGVDPLARALEPKLLGGVALVVLAVVTLGILLRHRQLRAGGAAVAEALGGRPLNPETHDEGERRLLNVVEEMAVASGMPVPAVYLLDDPAINAFAAGHTPQDAAIGVTRGAIECLDRDQLQGVIAHEFSHILHGDMRLNLRLVALLHGLLVIGLAGRLLLHGAGRRRMMSGRQRDNGRVALLGLGVALMAVGYAGTLCGNLIRAAVSRQREFLADASAVQYTRNPEGIGGALQVLAAHRPGSRLSAANAEEFSHLYFGSGVALGRLTATHPPLEERIRRVLPHWDGTLPAPPSPPERPEASGEETPAADRRLVGAALGVAVAASVGHPEREDLARARRCLAGIDERLIAAAHEPFAARALVYGILMSDDPARREAQRRTLIGQALPEVLAELERLDGPLSRLTPGDRLALVELALPLLRQLSVAQFARFHACLETLVRGEEAPEILRWSLYRLVLDGIQGQRHARHERRLAELGEPLSVLLSALARAGWKEGAAAHRALVRGAEALGVSVAFAEVPAASSDLDAALERLRSLVPAERAALLAAMTGCVEQDGEIFPEVLELLRALAWNLGCPLPLGAGQATMGPA